MSRGSTRRELLVSGAAAGAAGALVTLMGGDPAAAAGAPAPESDAERVHRLVSVELLALFTYRHILSSSILATGARRALAPLRAHEEAHVRELRTRLLALGGTVPAPPADTAAADRDLARRKVKGRLGQLRGSRDALDLMLALERVVIGVYFVALAKLEDPKLISLSAQIMAGEAQHEAVLGELLYPGDAAMAVPYGLVQGVL
jgi:Ferritin-like domain